MSWQRGRRGDSVRPGAPPALSLGPSPRATPEGLLTLSKTRKASRISSSLSVSFIFLAIMVKNSGKSMVPFPGQGGGSWEHPGTGPWAATPTAPRKAPCAQGCPGVRLTVCVHLVDHVLQLCFGGVLSQGPHHCPQLLGGDSAIPILVKKGEGLLELWGARGDESEARTTVKSRLWDADSWPGGRPRAGLPSRHQN